MFRLFDLFYLYFPVRWQGTSVLVIIWPGSAWLLSLISSNCSAASVTGPGDEGHVLSDSAAYPLFLFFVFFFNDFSPVCFSLHLNLGFIFVEKKTHTLNSFAECTGSIFHTEPVTIPYAGFVYVRIHFNWLNHQSFMTLKSVSFPIDSSSSY